MTSEQLESALNTESVPAPVTVPAESEEPSTVKRVYTTKEEMQRGQEAILAVLTTDGDGLSKAQILAALSTEDRALIERNWNLRIALLEETQQVRTKGQKVAKRYWRA